MPLTTYQGLQLDADGHAVSRLVDQMASDADAPALRLTGDGDPGAASANLTPVMNSWLNSVVGQVRREAISSIEMAAAQIQLGGGVHGIVPEIEDDKLKRHRNQRRSEVQKTFYDKNRAELDDLAQTEREFQAMRTYEGGREPRNPGRLLDLLIPLAIMIPEGFMNYKYFYDYMQLGIVALGSTIVVGLGIGWAAYIAGRFWKAYHFYMQPDRAQQREKGLRMISIASSLLTVALIAVGAVRYFGVVRQAEELVALGELPPNPLIQTGFLLFGNLLVFALGLAITYWLHDENPLYAEKAEAHARQKRKVEKLRQRELIEQLAEIDDAYKQSSERMHNQARQMADKQGYTEIRRDLGILSAKDNEIVSVLQDYRQQLCQRLKKDKEIYLENGQSVEISSFAIIPINLYRC